MKNINRIFKQCGFFDLGLSLIILAAAGTTAAMTMNNDENYIAETEQNELVLSKVNKNDDLNINEE